MRSEPPVLKTSGNRSVRCNMISAVGNCRDLVFMRDVKANLAERALPKNALAIRSAVRRHLKSRKKDATSSSVVDSVVDVVVSPGFGRQLV